MGLSTDTTNSGFDSSLTSFHNDDCDLCLSSNTSASFVSMGYKYNDSSVGEHQSPLVSDDTRNLSLPSDSGLQLDMANRSKFNSGSLNLGNDSTIGDGFDLGSSSVVHPSINDDFDFNPYSLWKKIGNLLIKICLICQGTNISLKLFSLVLVMFNVFCVGYVLIYLHIFDAFVTSLEGLSLNQIMTLQGANVN